MDASDVEKEEVLDSELDPPDLSVSPTETDSYKNLPRNRQRESKRYVINRIIYKGNCDETHPTEDVGKILYRATWLV